MIAHIAAALVMAATCIALTWWARGHWDRAGRDVNQLADLETEAWLDELTGVRRGVLDGPEAAVLDPAVRIDEAAFAADMRARTDRFIAAIRAGDVG